MTNLSPIQASPSHAEAKFGFLPALGFRLEERWTSGGQSFRDGWKLTYTSPAVRLVVSYLDQQLELVFEKDGISADYLLIDSQLFARRSGWHGNMFPPQKLAGAIDQLAADVQQHYGLILSGDAKQWERIQSALQATRERKLA